MMSRYKLTQRVGFKNEFLKDDKQFLCLHEVLVKAGFPVPQGFTVNVADGDVLEIRPTYLALDANGWQVGHYETQDFPIRADYDCGVYRAILGHAKLKETFLSLIDEDSRAAIPTSYRDAVAHYHARKLDAALSCCKNEEPLPHTYEITKEKKA